MPDLTKFTTPELIEALTFASEQVSHPLDDSEIEKECRDAINEAIRRFRLLDTKR